MGVVMSIDTGNKMMKTNHFIFHWELKEKNKKFFLEKKGFFLKGLTTWKVIRGFPIWKIKPLMTGIIF